MTLKAAKGIIDRRCAGANRLMDIAMKVLRENFGPMRWCMTQQEALEYGRLMYQQGEWDALKRNARKRRGKRHA